MRRLGLGMFFIIYLFLFLRGSPGMPQGQDQSENADRVVTNPSEEAGPTCQDSNSLAFYQNLSQVPVRFVGISEDKEVLTGQFASPTVIFFKQLRFRLTPKTEDEHNIFFQIDGKWEKEISRKTFLKKIKKDFWLLSYLTVNEENIICQAHQFRDWQSLRSTYSGENSIATDTMEFWGKMRVKSVFFYHMEEIKNTDKEIISSRAYWVATALTNGISMPGDDVPVLLDNGNLYTRTQKFKDGTEARIIEHGIFNIDNQTVFHTVDVKNPRLPRIKLSRIELGMLKIRLRPVDKIYFIKNLLVGPWACFYDEDSNKLLRVVEPFNQEDGNGKNNGKNGENKNQIDSEKR